MNTQLARAAFAAALIAPSLCAQGLSARIDGAPAGAVVFSFPARSGVCEPGFAGCGAGAQRIFRVRSIFAPRHRTS